MTLPKRIVAYLVAGVVVLALLGAIQYYRAAARRERLERLNAEAVADSTHHFLRGQLQIATRLVVQKPLPRKATATVTINMPRITIAPPPLTLRLTDPLRAQLDTNGVHVAAVVYLKPPIATWTWTLVQDPVSYRVTFERCTDHAAQVRVEGPRWQTAQLVDVQQHPNICNPAPGWRLFSLKPPSAVWVVVIAGVTYLVVK